MKTEWKKYTGSDEQIAEIYSAKHGVIFLFINGRISSVTKSYASMSAQVEIGNIDKYMICAPHQYADMICQWARTCQPVYVKTPARIWPEHAYIGDDLGGSYCTTEPNWNIPGAEYRFTPFDEEVCK